MRLLSYNIHKGIGGRDRRYRLERIFDVIEETRPDVLCLQEVARGARRSRRQNQPLLLKQFFSSLHEEKVSRCFQLNVRYQRGGGYGNLILSRWPIQSKHLLSLRHGKKKPRGAQVVVLDSPAGPLHLVNVHLGLAERERHWQVGHLLEHRLFTESTKLPTVVMGDFNDWRNTLARNCFAEQGFAQITAPMSRFRTFPAYLPVGSLDKAFVRGGIEVERAQPVRSKKTRTASDHLPLVVDLDLA